MRLATNNISDEQSVTYTNVDVSMYSPCTVTVQNKSNMTGQVVGGTGVTLQNQFTMTFKPVLVPGVGNIDGFTEDIAYKREVRPS